MYMRTILLPLLILLTLVASSCKANPPLSPEDQTILTRFFEYARQQRLLRLPVNERIVAIGQFFINTPYKGGTLDINAQEQLVVNLRELDCVTFVDNVLALALLEKYDQDDTNAFLQNLQNIRYRNGKITDYTARLHYSTDWLHEMQRAGILKDVTRQNGGIPFSNKVNFISEHGQRYPALKRDSTLVPVMARIENDINARTYYYLPKGKVTPSAGPILPGDILLITTNKKGLDTAHVGIAVEQDGKIRLLHASITAKKVTVSDTSLPEYLNNIRSHTGVIIARPEHFKTN